MGVKPRWTDEEVKLVKRWFAWKGSKGTQRILARHGFTRNQLAIREKARRLRCDGYAPEGYTVLSDIHSGHGSNRSSRAIRQAIADGVLRRSNKTWVVPDVWANKFIDQTMQEYDEAVSTEHYVLFKTVADAAGMKYKTLIKQYHEHRDKGLLLREYDARKVREPHLRYKVHPDVLRDPRLYK